MPLTKAQREKYKKFLAVNRPRHAQYRAKRRAKAPEVRGIGFWGWVKTRLAKKGTPNGML